jgi:hypothetical protein
LLDGAGRGEIYDPFNYDFVEENPGEGTTIPTWYSNVWATIVVATIARVASVISLGHNANAMTIPSGNPSLFDLKYRSFIPPAFIKGPYPADGCWDSAGNWVNVYYAGDNRTYSPFSGSYKAHSEALVSADSGSALSKYMDAGTITRYAADALASDGYTLRGDSILHDGHLTDDVLKESNSDMHVSVSGGGGSVSANFYGSAQNAATSWGYGTPSIDWNVTFTIGTANNPASPAYTFEYTHDCFPTHEAYIGTQRIYGFTPNDYSGDHIAACLAGLAKSRAPFLAR